MTVQKPLVRTSLADQVFDNLHARVLNLDLAPGARISEAEISKELGVSRQVIRDAFYRLSLLGFLVIRPQKATRVSLISRRDIMQARFLRTSIEIEIARRACEVLQSADFDALADILAQQRRAIEAGDQNTFHVLDNLFHQEICVRSGYAFAWDTIHEKKAHTDRVRVASLSFASHNAMEEHEEILAAMRAREEERAVLAVRAHLTEIAGIIEKLCASNPDWFEENE
ncbi:putative HTH-type transcriptional regulator YdfH [Cognatishimia activa]|uniref:Putative HTH-type transcriptional regulator YdfH n=1 Tax=Cognatishimia activa TaxID=1715691 RepID=A0A0P1IVI7_9RHOB|nr:GntR family transcriptional regulator [Cognatishimia activa]MEE2945961.1 GntR family transcriptional regulator [Pseudomonadota bacterium]CUK27494.1 putative HTH-type transcriptional regulator YdfH [Cognatishimia activa]